MSKLRELREVFNKPKNILKFIIFGIWVLISLIPTLATLNNWSYISVMFPYVIGYMIWFLSHNLLGPNRYWWLLSFFWVVSYAILFIFIISNIVLSNPVEFSKGPHYLPLAIPLVIAITAFLTNIIHEEKISEKEILEGLKYSAYPATLAALSVGLHALLENKELTRIATVFFIVSSFFVLVYYWYINIKEEKDDSLLTLLRIFSVGFFFGGLVSLLSAIMPI